MHMMSKRKRLDTVKKVQEPYRGIDCQYGGYGEVRRHVGQRAGSDRAK